MTRIVCLVGPTGTGKTEAALHLCRRFRGVVLNADSRQVYRDLPLVTAQPSPEEQGSCPHRLYGFLGLDQKITAGSFVGLADEAIAETSARGLLPILVGGTGLYFRALIQGIAPVPPVPEEVHWRVLAELEALGPEILHHRLAALDPDYASKIHPNDRQRITRALEVVEASGRPFSWWHGRQSPEPRYQALTLGLALPPAVLEARLDLRIEAMLAAGAVDEMRRALALTPDADAPAYSGIGCPELIGFLRGQLSLDEARALWLRNTRAYAKRQMTWFKKEPGIRWFAPGEHEAMAAAVEEFLGSSL